MSLEAWERLGSTFPCRETGDYSIDSVLSKASAFPSGGAEFVAHLNAYLSSAATLATSALNWPLDDPALVFRLSAAAFAPLDAAAQAQNAVPRRQLLPHVARVDFPVGTEVHVFGDLHGSFHSLLRTLRHLSDAGALDASTLALAPSHAVVFLGDYVDRGTRGVETMALLLALKTANVRSVFMARGNHEDLNMNEGSFLAELQAKFPGSRLGVQPGVLEAVARVYESLPRALFLGVKDPLPGWCHSEEAAGGLEGACPPGALEGLKLPWRGMPPPPRHLQGVHGGLEVGFDPRPLLHFYRQQDAALHPEAAQVYFALMHGYARAQWVEALPGRLRGAPVIPPAFQEEVKRGIFRDWGLPLLGPTAPSGSGSGEAEALAQARAARALAGAQWGGAAWPLEPLAVEPADGFMWADFIVSGWRRTGPGTQEGIVNARGRGVAYGKDLTEHYLGERGLVGVLRAHQHNNAGATGPMLERVIGGRGAFNNWGTPENGGQGAVTTFLSGAFIPGLGFERDAHGVLVLGGTHPANWTLALCSQRVKPGLCTRAAGGGMACERVLWRAVRGEHFGGEDTGHAAPPLGGGLPPEFEDGARGEEDYEDGEHLPGRGRGRAPLLLTDL